MYNSDRYGVVETNADGQVTSFLEKQFYPQAQINGGVYALNLAAFHSINFGEVFSFEKDYLEKSFESGKIFGLIQNGYFIDIGIPEDYNRAQLELKID
jgi:D-glycero-alpha-D-manno-heptose 1-phosphate guanylyltransferase